MAGRFTDNFRLLQNWQMGQSQSESTLSLLRAGLYADVWFCCNDQDQSDKTDRIAAHKLILASRSPVFEAMFYGHHAEPSNEIELPNTEKTPFLLFLRYLYSDNTDLSEEYAVDVMQIAHKYRVTTCLAFCSRFLQEIVRPDNACYLLEQARLLNVKGLVRAASNCVDDNASAVIQTEGFKVISPETLEYILKGSTFFVPEIDIVKAVDEWAINYLEEQGMKIDSANKRLAMGNAFYYLRLPSLSIKDFTATQLRYDLLTNEEEKNTARYIIQKEDCDLCNSNEDRKPRKATYFRSVIACGEPREVPFNTRLESSVTLTSKEDIELEEIILLLKKQTNQLVYADCNILTSADVKVISVKTCMLFENDRVELSPGVVLQASKSPYKIHITLESKDIRNTLAEHHETFSIADKIVQKPLFGEVVAAQYIGLRKQSVASVFGRSTATQTGEDTGASRSVTLETESIQIQNCFIQGVRYAHKTCRD